MKNLLKNRDEVLALMNLFKMSVLETRQRRGLHPLSIYGTHFYDDTFKYGNQTWEFEAYDKQAEIRNHRERYVQTSSEDIYERLVDESKNILRIEYRRKKNGTQKGSTGFVDKNVMRFLSEQVAEEIEKVLPEDMKPLAYDRKVFGIYSAFCARKFKIMRYGKKKQVVLFQNGKWIV